jgi:hypothetical protein
MQGMQTGNKLGEDVNVKTLEKWRKNTVLKINGKEIKVVVKFVCLGSVVGKIGKIQNEINEGIGKVSEFYLLA